MANQISSSGRTSGAQHSTAERAHQNSQTDKNQQNGNTLNERLSALKSDIDSLRQQGGDSKLIRAIEKNMKNAKSFLLQAKNAKNDKAKRKNAQLGNKYLSLAEKGVKDAHNGMQTYKNLKRAEQKTAEVYQKYQQLHSQKPVTVELPKKTQQHGVNSKNGSNSSIQRHSPQKPRWQQYFQTLFKAGMDSLRFLFSANNRIGEKKSTTHVTGNFRQFTGTLQQAQTLTRNIMSAMHKSGPSKSYEQNIQSRQIYHLGKAASKAIRKTVKSFKGQQAAKPAADRQTASKPPANAIKQPMDLETQEMEQRIEAEMQKFEAQVESFDDVNMRLFTINDVLQSTFNEVFL